MKGYMVSNDKYHERVCYFSHHYEKYSFYLSLEDCPQGAAGTIYEINALGKIRTDKDNDKVFRTDLIEILRALPAGTKENKVGDGNTNWGPTSDR